MANQDHAWRGDYCVYCLETWPCRTARILQEAAAYIRQAHSDGAYEGWAWTADLIEPGPAED